MLLISVLGSLITLLLTAFFLMARKQRRKKLERRLHGLTVLQSGLDLMTSVQQHRGMSVAWRNGDESFAARISTKKTEIQGMLNKIRPLLDESPELIPDLSRLTQIIQLWNTLSGNLGGMSPDQCFNEHTALIRVIVHLIGDMGEHLGLLDGEGTQLAKLSNILLLRVPLLLESIGQARALGSGYAAQGQIGAVGRIRLDFLASRILECREAITSLELSNLNATAAATTKIELVLNTLQDQFISAEQVEISPDMFFGTATEAIDACITLWREVAQQTGKAVSGEA